MTDTHHVTGNVKQAGAVAGRPVYVHDAATGILLNSGNSNPVTGDYDIGLESDDPVYVTANPSPGFLPGMAGEVVPLPTFATLIAQHGAIGYWEFDETSGTTAADASSNANDGTYTGGFTLDQEPLRSQGRAVELNGSTGYISVPSIAAYQSLTSFSVSCAVSATVGAKKAILHLGDFAVSGNQGIHFFVNSAGGLTLETFAGGSYKAATTDSAVLSTDVTAYITVAFNEATGNVEFMKDGVLLETKALPGGSLGTTNSSLKWGTVKSGSLVNFLDGTLDACSIYDYALTEAQHAAQYAAL